MSIEVEKDGAGNSYVPVPIAKIEPGVELTASLYLKIDNKFIKFKNDGDYLEGEKLNYFLHKNLKHIYIEMDQLENFMEWLKAKRQEAVDEMVEEVGEEHRDLVEKREDIREKVYDTFTDMEMDSGVAEILQSQVKEFLEDVKEIDLSQAVLAKMLKHNSSIADHALNTANVATYIAMVLGHGNYQVLEDIYMGAIFHDYAKMKIPPEILENNTNARYNQAIQDHPRKGAVAVKKLDNIREPVIKIIEQHHEQYNGNGFPAGLKEDEIFGPAMIVAMANIFDNTVMENKNKPKKEKYRTAIKVLEYDKGKQFDPDMVEKVLTALKLAYGEYYIPPANS